MAALHAVVDIDDIDGRDPRLGRANRRLFVIHLDSNARIPQHVANLLLSLS